MVRKWLVDLRKEKGLTCKELGAKIGVSESYVFNLEQGARAQKGIRPLMVAQIAEAVGVSPMPLLQAEVEYLKDAGNG